MGTLETLTVKLSDSSSSLERLFGTFWHLE